MTFQIKSKNQMEKKDKRTGNTIISSVSISKEFDEIMKKNNFSPTDIFRKGLIIEAYEKGISIPGINMASDLIRERMEKYKEINTLTEFEDLEQGLLDLETQISIFRNKLIKIKKEVGSNEV